MYFEINEIPRNEKQDIVAILIAVLIVAVIEIVAVKLATLAPVVAMVMQALIVLMIVYLAIRFYKTKLKAYRYSFFTGEELSEQEQEKIATEFGISIESLKNLLETYPKNTLVIESYVGGVANILIEIAPDELKGLYEGDYKCKKTLVATITPKDSKKLVYGENQCVMISPSDKLLRYIAATIDFKG
ncbi:MAG: hypothetical protein GX802_00660 [Clostridiales bacterium]|jgi:hypothetical protein|nr:hypothetical protein [Clostridiales bacterium]